MFTHSPYMAEWSQGYVRIPAKPKKQSWQNGFINKYGFSSRHTWGSHSKKTVGAILVSAGNSADAL